MGCGATSSRRYEQDNAALPVHMQQAQSTPLSRDQVSHRSVPLSRDQVSDGSSSRVSPVTNGSMRVMDLIEVKEGSKRSGRSDRSKQERNSPSQTSLQNDRSSLAEEATTRPRLKSKDSSSTPTPLGRDDVEIPEEVGQARSGSKRSSGSVSGARPLTPCDVTVPEGASELYQSTAGWRSQTSLDDHAGLKPLGKDSVGLSRLDEGAEALSRCKEAAQVQKAQAGSAQKNWAKARAAGLMLAHADQVTSEREERRSLRVRPEELEEQARRDSRRSVRKTENGEVVVAGRGVTELVEGLDDPSTNQPWQQGAPLRTGWKTEGQLGWKSSKYK